MVCRFTFPARDDNYKGVQASETRMEMFATKCCGSRGIMFCTSDDMEYDIHCYNEESLKLITVFVLPPGSGGWVSMACNDRHLCVQGGDESVYVFDPNRQNECSRHQLSAFKSGISSSRTAINSSELYVISESRDYILHVDVYVIDLAISSWLCIRSFRIPDEGHIHNAVCVRNTLVLEHSNCIKAYSSFGHFLFMIWEGESENNVLVDRALGMFGMDHGLLLVVNDQIPTS